MNGSWIQSLDLILRLIFAMTAGAIIGLNRWLSHKPAGLGTHALVALGAALASVVVLRAPGADANAVSRVIQGLVTGVGFIGAGVIMRENSGQQIHGLTTAASIWISAIIGIACGISDFVVGVAGLVLALVVLVISKPLEEAAGRIFKHQHDEPIKGSRN